MTGAPVSPHLSATLRLDGPPAEVRALLARVLQIWATHSVGLPIPATAPGVTREEWDSGEPGDAGERLRGLRFRAGPVCAYVTLRAGLPAQVEFEVFAHEPCTLGLVLRELPALLAILGDPDFQATVVWQFPQGMGEPC